MNKILLIIFREYITRVRKKSFIIMTFLGPVLFASVFVIPRLLVEMEDKSVNHFAVLETDTYGNPVPDSMQLFRDVIPDINNLRFTYVTGMRQEDLLATFEATEYDGVVCLPADIMEDDNISPVEFYYRKPPSLSAEMHISNALEEYIFNQKLTIKQIPADVVSSLQTDIRITNINWKNWPDKKEDATNVKRGIGYAGGFLIYFFIFLFGTQVMRGVLEEKTNRIVEIIVSSVTPFQLMMGKIAGIGLTGLTQFVAWMLLTWGIAGFAQLAFMPDTALPADVSTITSQAKGLQSEEIPSETSILVEGILNQIREVNLPLVIVAFVFYFLGGYLLYGSLFAAIGAASDNETDTQQFMLPITIPLIIALFVMINTFLNPSGNLAVWFSIIPFTSPIVMMARIPFGVPAIQLISSVILLILTFLGTTWLAGKIYRTGILMYGKKVNYQELWKWLRYR